MKWWNKGSLRVSPLIPNTWIAQFIHVSERRWIVVPGRLQQESTNCFLRVHGRADKREASDRAEFSSSGWDWDLAPPCGDDRYCSTTRHQRASQKLDVEASTWVHGKRLSHCDASKRTNGPWVPSCVWVCPPGPRPAHRGHRPGQLMGLMQRPWNSTRLAGQWQPATQGLWHGPISFQFSQVLVQPGPQVSYTAPCLHWVAGGWEETES